MSVGPIQIQRIVAARYGLTFDELRTRRTPHCARARHIAMWLVRDILKWSYPAIGQAFERDHSTVMSGCAHVDTLFGSDPELQTEIALIKAQLGAHPKPPEAQRCDTCGQPLHSHRRVQSEAMASQLEQVAEQLRSQGRT